MKWNFLLFTLIASLLSAEIIETRRFSDVLTHVTEDTLVLLDIDDTLLLPKQTLGSDVWFCHRWDQLKKSGLSVEDALEKALAEWEAIRHLTEVKLVEEGSDLVVKELQAKGGVVMCLTTQGLALTTRTIQQLKKLNIDLSESGPSKDECYFLNDREKLERKEGVLYRKGILFTAGSKKGKALLGLFSRLGITPKHVLFINDKLSHLKDVEEDLNQAGIAFTGLRYAIGDERVKNFNPQITDIQWLNSTFEQILSDEDAARLISAPSR